MLARIRSYLLLGIEAHPCEVEVDLDHTQLERETVVGLPGAAVRESMERVRSAMANSGYPVPPGRTLINLAPADVRKEGPMYDLPIAVGLLLAQNAVPSGGLDPRRVLFAGELALDGRVRPVRGALAMADLARAHGMEAVVLPAENAREAAVVSGIDVYGVSTLAEVVGLLSGAVEAEPTAPVDVSGLISTAEPSVDFAEVKGQESVKRAMVIAAAGGHNLLELCPSDGNGRSRVSWSWLFKCCHPDFGIGRLRQMPKPSAFITSSNVSCHPGYRCPSLNFPAVQSSDDRRRCTCGQHLAGCALPNGNRC